ncbi:ABC transporter permease [Rhodococcoides kyotonense]|uniref:ABC-type nitrate/sulfonate/bicarbonate transport system, permease component n=1 Tax=Rhodococcoides kyotonense TaxID=398843 RepID=A0A239JY51_9NOCA|nr:ABC transporter permease subunit [Rhodococcus kyotonensis]SNT10579.1 ABC-type nitrate/sulfonate/bicarbonate transport system, permease component [Rhodococcus kyotonensis]
MTTRQALVLRTRSSGVGIAVGLVVALLGWEIAARALAATNDQADRVLPSLVTIADRGFLGLGHYYSGGLGVAASGDGSIVSSFAALFYNGLVTTGRVAVGLVLAIVFGIVLGLLVAAVRSVRLSVSGVAELMRMLPALAMAPLFTLWFGATSTASVVFIVFGAAFIVLIAVVNAVANLAPHVTEYPRTLGVSTLRLYSRVVLPAILPELRGPLVFAGLVAWTSVLASEMYGLQSGLGWMLNDTLRFSQIDRMFVVAVAFSALALVTMKLLGAAVNRATRWNA